jgi:hypothetical protein
VNANEIADSLYGLPLEEFTRARNEAERDLRKAGEREQADQVKSLRKPTVAAGTVNQLVRNHHAQVQAFLEAAADLRDAQFAGKGDLDSAARAEQAALDELVSLGGESVRITLEAAAVDDEIARDLLAGQLVREPEPAGFGTLLAHAPPHPPPRPRSKTRSGDSAARARLHEAKKLLSAAEVEEQQAQQHLAQTQRNLEKARAAVESAQRELDRRRRR